MRVVSRRERLVVCLSEYLPLRTVYDNSLVVCFSNISEYLFTLESSRKGESCSRRFSFHPVPTEVASRYLSR